MAFLEAMLGRKNSPIRVHLEAMLGRGHAPTVADFDSSNPEVLERCTQLLEYLEEVVAAVREAFKGRPAAAGNPVRGKGVGRGMGEGAPPPGLTPTAERVEEREGELQGAKLRRRGRAPGDPDTHLTGS